MISSQSEGYFEKCFSRFCVYPFNDDYGITTKQDDSGAQRCGGAAQGRAENGVWAGFEGPQGRNGQGPSQGATSNVTVHYTGWTTDGKMFDSSVVRGEPSTFPLDKVIKGWTEGVQMMVVGEKRRFWIPANLAYGDNPRPGAPKGMLVFDVELLSIAR